MNWYRRAQADETDDMVGESLKDFLLDDYSQHAAGRSDKGVMVFKGALEKLFGLFGFKIAGWGGESADDELPILVYPTRKVKEPTSYSETKAMKDRLEGLDKDKAARLIGALLAIPMVRDVSLGPANDSHDFAVFHLFFKEKMTLVFAGGSSNIRRAQDESFEDMLRDVMEEERQPSSLPPTGGVKRRFVPISHKSHIAVIESVMMLDPAHGDGEFSIQSAGMTVSLDHDNISRRLVELGYSVRTIPIQVTNVYGKKKVYVGTIVDSPPGEEMDVWDDKFWKKDKEEFGISNRPQRWGRK